MTIQISLPPYFYAPKDAYAVKQLPNYQYLLAKF